MKEIERDSADGCSWLVIGSCGCCERSNGNEGYIKYRKSFDTTELLSDSQEESVLRSSRKGDVHMQCIMEQGERDVSPAIKLSSGTKTVQNFSAGFWNARKHKSSSFHHSYPSSNSTFLMSMSGGGSEVPSSRLVPLLMMEAWDGVLHGGCCCSLNRMA